MLELTDRVAIVTGATGNLGRAAVHAFLAAGARVALVHRSRERLARSFPDLPRDRHILVGDIDQTDRASLAHMVEEVVRRFERIDVLCNTVGGFAGGKPVHEEEPEIWESLLATNLTTTLLTVRAVIPRMIAQRSGRIINTASPHALAGAARFAAYSAAKAAVMRLTESLDGELARHGISANCVIPGTMDTPANRQAMPDADFAAWVQPEAVAAVLVFLASDLARAVHGAAIPVYGPGRQTS